LDIWGLPHEKASTKLVTEQLDKILAMNASVNFYVFHGGTNFGFTSGALVTTDRKQYSYWPDVTSYDYDSPLTEAGDPTDKYYAIRDVIGKYLPLPNIPLPKPTKKGNYGKIQMHPAGHIHQLLDNLRDGAPVESNDPLTFESLRQYGGFVLYSTVTPNNITMPDPAILEVPGIKDRGYVFVEKQYVGMLDRNQEVFNIAFSIRPNQRLDILVENQGRIHFGKGIHDRKGILGNVTLGRTELKQWIHHRLPFNNYTQIQETIQFAEEAITQLHDNRHGEMILYQSTFSLEGKEPLDTYLSLDGWHKGFVFINEHNLGRYWPIVGPQETLYVPGVFLKPSPENNTITIFELENSPCDIYENCVVELVDQPRIDSQVPLNYRKKV